MGLHRLYVPRDVKETKAASEYPFTQQRRRDGKGHHQNRYL